MCSTRRLRELKEVQLVAQGERICLTELGQALMADLARCAWGPEAGTPSSTDE